MRPAILNTLSIMQLFGGVGKAFWYDLMDLCSYYFLNIQF